MSDIVFVHGFRSGRDSSKWAYIQEQYPDAYIFEVNYEEESPQDIATRLAQFCDGLDDPILIGHSLGAFFVRMVAGSHGYSSILINPSFRPHITLANYLVDMKAYEEMSAYTQSVRVWPYPAEIILVERGDEVINHTQQMAWYENSYLINLHGGNHRFCNVNMIKYAVEQIENRPWQ